VKNTLQHRINSQGNGKPPRKPALFSYITNVTQ